VEIRRGKKNTPAKPAPVKPKKDNQERQGEKQILLHKREKVRRDKKKDQNAEKWDGSRKDRAGIEQGSSRRPNAAVETPGKRRHKLKTNQGL